MKGSSKFAIHWPDRILGPPLNLKGINVLCWSAFVAFLLVPLFVNLWVQFRTGSGSIRKFDSDFVYFYGIGHLVNEYSVANLYDYGLQEKIFNQIYPAHEAFYGPSPYPPYVALFFRPFARVSFESAYLVWMAISLGLYISGIAAIVKEAFPRERLLMSLFFCFGLAFYPFVFGTLLNGQLASVAVFSVGLAILQERHSHPFYSGLALSVLAYKPTLLLLLLPMLVLTRRFKTLFGFLLGTLVLIVGTTAFTGIQIWPAYVHMLSHFGRSTGLRDQSALQLWKYIDFVSLSYAVSGGRTRAGVVILICLISTIALVLAVLLWKSVKGGESARNLAWAATLTWTLIVNIYVPIYDSVLITIAVILTLGALRDLGWSVAAGWITFLSLLTFAVSWKTESLAEHHGIQLLTVFIAALGVGQLLMLYRVIRDRSLC
ncbi:MAG: glycosyltransferase family 87 protein [Terriglobales bacterium]